jgi:hypothetical protein
VVFAVLALTARGPLGIVRVCGPRLHAALDIAAVVLLAVGPMVRSLRPGVMGIVAAELAALAWWRVAALTRYSGRDGTTAMARALGSSAPSSAPSAEGTTTGDGPPGTALAAIRGLGRATAAAKRRLPEPQSTLDTGARRIGGHVGRLQRAWRRAAR